MAMQTMMLTMLSAAAEPGACDAVAGCSLSAARVAESSAGVLRLDAQIRCKHMKMIKETSQGISLHALNPALCLVCDPRCTIGDELEAPSLSAHTRSCELFGFLTVSSRRQASSTPVRLGNARTIMAECTPVKSFVVRHNLYDGSRVSNKAIGADHERC